MKATSFELASDRGGQLLVEDFPTREAAIARAREYLWGSRVTQPQRIVHAGVLVSDRHELHMLARV